MIRFLENNPYNRIAIVCQDETMRDIRERLQELIDLDDSIFLTSDELKRAMYVPGGYRVAPDEKGRNRSKRTLGILEDVDAIIYDQLVMTDEISEFVEMYPEKKHIGIFQEKRRPQSSQRES